MNFWRSYERCVARYPLPLPCLLRVVVKTPRKLSSFIAFCMQVSAMLYWMYLLFYCSFHAIRQVYQPLFGRVTTPHRLRLSVSFCLAANVYSHYYSLRLVLLAQVVIPYETVMCEPAFTMKRLVGC